VPKSSRASRTPSARRSARHAAARSGSATSAVSVTSSTSAEAGSPLAARAAVIDPARSEEPSWVADTLTAIDRSPAPGWSRSQVAAVVQASRSTQSPIPSMRPAASATGTNRSGPTGPSRGEFQRSSASKPVTRRSASATTGW